MDGFFFRRRRSAENKRNRNIRKGVPAKQEVPFHFVVDLLCGLREDDLHGADLEASSRASGVTNRQKSRKLQIREGEDLDNSLPPQKRKAKKRGSPRRKNTSGLRSPGSGTGRRSTRKGEDCSHRDNHLALTKHY